MFETLIPLEHVSSGCWVEVSDVNGSSPWLARLGELGVRGGTRLRVLQSGCPCLVQIGDCRLSLRLDDTMQVLVRPLPNGAAAYSEVA